MAQTPQLSRRKERTNSVIGVVLFGLLAPGAAFAESSTGRLLEASHKTQFIVTVGSVGIVLLIGWTAWKTRRELVARRQAAELQLTARRDAESIVDAVREPLLVLDQELRVERANRAFYQSFQTSPALIERRLFSEIGDGQWNQPRLSALLAGTLSHDTKFDNVEWEYDLPGLGRRTMLLNGSKLNRPGDGAPRILLTIEDVTERKRADETLRAGEEQFRMVVEAIEDYAIFMLDTEGHVVSWNRGAEHLKGYSAKEIVGRHLSRFYLPEDVTAGRPERMLNTARETGRAEEEGWRLRQDGSRFFANATITAIRGENGELRGFAKVTRDVSERHRLSQMHVHFRALFDSLPGLFLVMTPDFKIVAVSNAYLQATMTRRDDLIGRGLFDVFPDNPDLPGATGVTNLRASLQRVLKSSQTDTMAIQRYDIQRPDGVFEERYWSPMNSPLLGADERIEYLIHRVEDVTDFIKQRGVESNGQGGVHARLERMESEIFRSSQQVQMANLQLRAANSELEAFSYSVSHDLRAPLRHIDGFADLLGKYAGSALDDKGRRYLKTISDSATRMGALIDDLLVFSRIGRAEMRCHKVDLNALADEVIHELRVETNGRNVDWRRQGLPVVEGDSALLRQVLVNLFSNAVKYTRPRDPAIIEIGLVPSAIENTIYVRDNGVGFEMTYVTKLFGVFQRLHRNDEFEGTGIGLANVHRIISRHGGRTWAEGILGEGATFYFSLPIGTMPSLAMPPATALSPETISTP